MKNNPMHSNLNDASPKRCGAKTRSGELCKSYAANGKGRCRMHGGAIGSGAPYGNKNALKQGYYTRTTIGKRRGANKLVKDFSELLCELRGAN